MSSEQAAVRSLRHGITWARSRAWHWQTVAHITHSPTVRGAGRFHSAGYLRWVEFRWNRRRLRAYRLAHRPVYRAHFHGSVQSVICSVFGAYCSQALAVASCESGFSTSATNGQYEGIFQMGESERATYGNGVTAFQQAHAAYRYFVASGRDWSPWSCKP